jgi:RNA polymerase sigma-70 factor (ECF subfamily)
VRIRVRNTTCSTDPRPAASLAVAEVAGGAPEPRPAAHLALVEEAQAGAPDPLPPAVAHERALVAGILAGSRRHFDELYEGYFHRVYRFALKRLGDSAEAEDVTQEVFETIFRVLPSYRGDSSLIVWIFGIARNKVNRRFRGVRPRLESLEDSGAERVAAEVPATDEAVDARRMLRRCDEVVSRRLTPLQRRIFHLKHLRRQPIRTIAQSLGKSEDAIKANLYRMRRTLAAGAPGLEAFLDS